MFPGRDKQYGELIIEDGMQLLRLSLTTSTEEQNGVEQLHCYWYQSLQIILAHYEGQVPCSTTCTLSVCIDLNFAFHVSLSSTAHFLPRYKILEHGLKH